MKRSMEGGVTKRMRARNETIVLATILEKRLSFLFVVVTLSRV